MNSILVTGGAGFIGSHLVERLLAEGAAVTVLDNFDPFYAPEQKRDNLEVARRSSAFRLIEGDIRDRQRLDDVFSTGAFDAVVHLAARAGVRPSIADPAGYVDVNVNGTTAVLEACRRHAVLRMIFASSSSVYGNNVKVPFAEEDAVDHPVSPYAATKKSGELLCHAYHHLFGMRIACLRYFTVYGPRQRPEMAIHAFARKLAAGEPVTVFGDGGSARDYTFVSDAVDGTVRALRRSDGFRVFNLGGARTTTLVDLVRKLARALGVEAQFAHQAAQAGDVERTWADVRRAQRELGWEAAFDIDAGLAAFVEWFSARRAPESGRAGGR